MTDTNESGIDAAAARLDAALARLEGVVARRLEADAIPDDRETELAIMAEDRARLAAALDTAQAALERAEAAADAVGLRLDRAIDTVEAALAEPSGSEHTGA
ncbi:DUF4164 family protein [Methylobacterium sp. A54F]